MNILIFEYHNFGIEDVKECFEKTDINIRLKKLYYIVKILVTNLTEYLIQNLIKDAMEKSMIVYLLLIIVL